MTKLPYNRLCQGFNARIPKVAYLTHVEVAGEGIEPSYSGYEPGPEPPPVYPASWRIWDSNPSACKLARLARLP
jgi:hypothetical protein